MFLRLIRKLRLIPIKNKNLIDRSFPDLIGLQITLPVGSSGSPWYANVDGEYFQVGNNSFSLVSSKLFNTLYKSPNLIFSISDST